MASRRSPVRTCVGCREQATAAELLRVVAAAGEGGSAQRVLSLVPDPDRRLPGRGASVHPDPGCVELAERRRAFPRALRVPGPLDTSAVRAYVAAHGTHEDRAGHAPQPSRQK